MAFLEAATIARSTGTVLTRIAEFRLAASPIDRSFNSR
jgi:hypothetical protein